MKKIIVTGGAGYIGSHTVVELDRSGFEPIIIDNLCNSSIRNIDGISKIIKKEIKWYNVDCTDKKSISRILSKENEISAIIHFAAYKSVEESVRFPKKYYTNNIDSLRVILDCMKEREILNIIFSSSCTVYGNPDYLPVDERSVFKKASSPYGETKQICENMIKEAECNSVSLRYFNPVGCHDSILIGDCSNDKPNNLLPMICDSANKKNIFKVFGGDYDTHDGTCIRDYIHIIDLANSHVKSLKFLEKHGGKHAFNVGTGKGVSVLEFIQAFEKANKQRIKYSIVNRRKGDIEKIFADNKLIKQTLNWQAVNTLSSAMRSEWKWKTSD